MAPKASRVAASILQSQHMHLAAQTLAGLCVIIGLFIVLDILDS